MTTRQLQRATRINKVSSNVHHVDVDRRVMNCKLLLSETSWKLRCDAEILLIIFLLWQWNVVCKVMCWRKITIMYIFENNWPALEITKRSLFLFAREEWRPTEMQPYTEYSCQFQKLFVFFLSKETEQVTRFLKREMTGRCFISFCTSLPVNSFATSAQHNYQRWCLLSIDIL